MRKKHLGLLRRNPPVLGMLFTHLEPGCVVDGATELHTDHLVFGQGSAPIEVRCAEKALNPHLEVGLFECLPAYRFRKAFPLYQSARRTLLLPGGPVLLSLHP